MSKDFISILTTLFFLSSIRKGQKKKFYRFFPLFIYRRVLLTLILFLGRGVIAGLFQAAYVYTPEVYPTNLRSVGVGGCSSLARLGAM